MGSVTFDMGSCRESLDFDAESLRHLSIVSYSSSAYTIDSQPRCCFDINCTFPMGPMCTECALDRAERVQRMSKRESYQRRWSSSTEYNGELFVTSTPHLDELEERTEEDISSETEGEETDNEIGHETSPLPLTAIPGSFVSEPDVGHESSSSSRPNSASTQASSGLSRISSVSPANVSLIAVSSNDSTRSDSSTHIEPWTSDIYDRTREVQMEDKVFFGGAKEDPRQEICPLCKNPVGDPTFQHVLRCQFAHDERERLGAALFRL